MSLSRGVPLGFYRNMAQGEQRDDAGAAQSKSSFGGESYQEVVDEIDAKSHLHQQGHAQYPQPLVPQQGYAQYPQPPILQQGYTGQPVLVEQHHQVPQEQSKPPPQPQIPKAYQVGKSGQQLAIILGHIWYYHQMENKPIYFGQNRLGARYVIFGYEFIFFEDKLFEDKLKSYAITNLGLQDLSNTAIKNTISVLRAQSEYWLQDDALTTNPYVRVVNQGYPNIFYFYSPSHRRPLTNVHPVSHPAPSGILKPASAVVDTPVAVYDQQTVLSSEQEISKGFVTTPSLDSLLDWIGIAKKYHPVVLGWMVHGLVARDYYLLELTSDSDQHTFACEKIKEVIDPSKNRIKKILGTAMGIAKLGLQDYLIDLYSDKKLNAVQQEALLDLMTRDGVKVDGLKNKLDKAQCFIKRPFILGANDTVVSDPKLRARTLTIPVNCTQEPMPVNFPMIINQARADLMVLTSFCSAAIYDSNEAHEFHREQGSETLLDRYPQFEELVKIIAKLAQVTKRDPQIGMDLFVQWVTESMFLDLDDQDTAYLIYLWAKDQINKKQALSASGSIKDWKEKLSDYAKAEGIDWDSKSFRSIGEDFKSSNQVLNRLGIRVESSGRSKRLSDWTITLPAELGSLSLKVKECVNPRQRPL